MSSNKSILATLRKSMASVFPAVTTRLLQEIISPEPDFKKIGEIISLDPGLAAAILSMANSPAYGQTQKVVDIHRAAVILGNKELLRIALSLSFQKTVKTALEKKGIDPYANWRMIIWSAIAAEELALYLVPEKSNMAYICALLKDLSILLLCGSSKNCLDLFDNGEDIITLRSDQLDREKEILGYTHPVLTQILLDDWDLPDFCYNSIVQHHQLERAASMDRFSQCVTLATRWAEVEFKSLNKPEPLFQFQAMLAKIPGLNREIVTALRDKCSARFQAICSSLELDGKCPGTGLYDYSLQTMQTYYFQTMEVQTIQGGVQALAAAVAGHIRWNWGIEIWELLLFDPNVGKWQLFRQPGPLQPLIHGDICTDKKPGWKLPGPGIEIKAEDRSLAEFRYPRQSVPKADKNDLELYFRFLGHAFVFYYQQQAAMESKARTLDLLPVGVARLDENGRILQANSRFRIFFPQGREGAVFWPVISSRAKIPSDAKWKAFLTGSPEATYSRLFCPLGTRAQNAKTCVYINAHKVVFDGRLEIMALAEDISQVAELEHEAIQQREFLHSLLNAMQDLVFTVNEQGIIQYASSDETRHLVGRNLFQVTTPESVYSGSWGPKSLEDGVTVEVKMLLGAGRFRSLELIISPLNKAATSFLVVGRDLTQIRRLEEKIKRQAAYDNLTELFNRHQFQLAIEREVTRNGRTKRSLGIIFFDVDNFKEYNDAYGHQEGDKVLKSIGDILRKNLRKGMDYPCRYGGDEFVVLVTEVQPRILEKMAQRITTEFRERFNGVVTLSMGLAMHAEGETGEQLLYRADHASYDAKAKGGDDIFWSQRPGPAS